MHKNILDKYVETYEQLECVLRLTLRHIGLEYGKQPKSRPAVNSKTTNQLFIRLCMQLQSYFTIGSFN